MRRFLTAGLAAMTLLGVLAIPASAAPKTKGCADLRSTSADGNTASRASWDGQNTGDVNGQFFLAAASCKNVTYTLVILEDETSTTPIATGSVTGDGKTPYVIISIPAVTAADTDVCAYVTSGTKNKPPSDVAPDTGCVILFDDGTSPAGGKGF